MTGGSFSYGDMIAYLEIALTVALLVDAFAIFLACVAILEMRRMRLIAAARDPLWNASEDDALPPFYRGLVERFRRSGGA